MVAPLLASRRLMRISGVWPMDLVLSSKICMYPPAAKLLSLTRDFPPKRRRNAREDCYERVPKRYKRGRLSFVGYAQASLGSRDHRQALRPPDDETLHKVDAHARHGIQCPLVLDMFRDHTEIQAARQLDHGRDHGLIHRISGEIPDEGAVDLQIIHRQCFQRRE